MKSLSRVQLYTCSIKSTAALNAKATSTGQCCIYAGHPTVSSRSEQALWVPKKVDEHQGGSKAALPRSPGYTYQLAWPTLKHPSLTAG